MFPKKWTISHFYDSFYFLYSVSVSKRTKSTGDQIFIPFYSKCTKITKQLIGSSATKVITTCSLLKKILSKSVASILHLSYTVCGSDWSLSTSISCVILNAYNDICCASRMKPDDWVSVCYVERKIMSNVFYHFHSALRVHFRVTAISTPNRATPVSSSQ